MNPCTAPSAVLEMSDNSSRKPVPKTRANDKNRCFHCAQQNTFGFPLNLPDFIERILELNKGAGCADQYCANANRGRNHAKHGRWHLGWQPEEPWHSFHPTQFEFALMPQPRPASARSLSLPPLLRQSGPGLARELHKMSALHSCSVHCHGTMPGKTL